MGRIPSLEERIAQLEARKKVRDAHKAWKELSASYKKKHGKK